VDIEPGDDESVTAAKIEGNAKDNRALPNVLVGFEHSMGQVGH
jgi:hypothetical protein